MAILSQPQNRANPFAEVIGDALAPEGTYPATILDVLDQMDVTRQKFQSTEVEKVDLTCFLFGYRDAQGTQHHVASREMRISGHEKSNLVVFLTNLLGRRPAYGWDYCSLKGQQCLLTVAHVPRRDGNGVYAVVKRVCPAPIGLQLPPQAAVVKGMSPQPERLASPTSEPVAPVHAPSVASAHGDDVPF